MFKTWGETFTSSFSLGIFNVIVFAIAAIPIFGGVTLLSSGSAILGGVLIGVGALLAIAGVLITSTLDSILLAALYIYAEEGTVPNAYDATKFSKAFVNR